MNRIIITLLLVLSFISCSKEQESLKNDDIYVETFEVFCSDSWIKGEVDNENRLITIKGIQKGSFITDVRYSLTGKATVFPEPETWLGNWSEEETFLLKYGDKSIKYSVKLEGLLYNTVRISNTKRQKLFLGVDAERLWYWRSEQAYALADLAVGELKSSYVRVAINCEYERDEGVINVSAYDKILEVMNNMKQINPDILFFASPRPLAEAYSKDEIANDWNGAVPWSPYPTWVYPVKQGTNGKWDVVDSQFKIDKLIRYYSDYLNFMHEKGFKISYLDATNEKKIITPSLNKQLYNGIKSTIKPGVNMPDMIVPSSWSREQGVDWLNSVKGDEKDYFSIAATHNTGEAGTSASFVNKARSLEKSPWNSELHGWVGIETIDEVLNSEVFWEHLRAGFEGIDTWLFYGPLNGKDHTMIWSSTTEIKKSAKYEIFKQVVNNSNGGYYYDIDIPDNENTITAAFQKDNVLSVWILNKGEKELKDLMFLVDERVIDENIECVKWNGSLPKNGESYSFDSYNENSFKSNIEPKSLYYFKMIVK